MALRKIIPVVLLLIFSSLTMMNWLLHHHVSRTHPARVVRGALIDDVRVQTSNAAPINPATQHRPKRTTNTEQYLARRPAAAAAPLVDQMMYWNRYIAKMPPADKSWLPAVRPDKYLLASVDPGGFNNIRLSFEVQVTTAPTRHPPGRAQCAGGAGTPHRPDPGAPSAEEVVPSRRPAA